MPIISKIRFTNVLYEGGAKRYNDSTFYFDGHNSAIVLENGGGKTVFIQTALQAVLPHSELAGRKIKDTLSLENGPAHVAIEWMLTEKPRRRYVVTCVSLFMSATGLDSLRYVYEYPEQDHHRLEMIPFTKSTGDGNQRVAEKGEIQEYYHGMAENYSISAKTFHTITDFRQYIESQFHIIQTEWEAIAKINSNEGGIEAFFDECKTSSQLVDRLLIPTIEESIEGFRKGAFADLFQAQRDGFKRFKELREKIGENQRILTELNKYVIGYEKLHRQQVQYAELRKEGKMHVYLAESEEQKQLEEQIRLQREMEAWEARRNEWRKREASLKIADERLKEDELAATLDEIGKEMDQLERQFSAMNSYYYSLKYAEYREKLRDAQERIASLQQEMARLSQSQDQEELQQAWELNGRKLKAYFDHEEQHLSERLSETGTSIDALNERKQEFVRERDRAVTERENLLLQIKAFETERKAIQDQQRGIAGRILSQLSSQSVEQQMPVWIAEQESLEQDGLEQVKAFKELDRRRAQLQREERKAQDERLRYGQVLTELKGWRDQYEQEHDRVKRMLAGLQPAWERLVSVHEKMDSIEQKLAEGLENRIRQKQQLLHQERLAFRYVDDYRDEENFFADPQVARWVEQWSNQFSLLETGTHYVSAVGTVIDRALWAVTLLTTSQEKPLVQRKIAEAADQLQFPIRVLSTQEAKQLANGIMTEAEETWVEPAHWKSLQSVERFKEWKLEVLHRASVAEETRKQKENELDTWREGQRLSQKFFHEYPLVAVHEQEQRRVGVVEQLKGLEQRLSQLELELQQTERQKNELGEAQRLLAQRQQHVMHQLEQGQLYNQLSQRIGRISDDLQPLRIAREQAERLKERCGQDLAVLERELTQRESEYRDIEGKMEKLHGDELYSVVRDCAPFKPEESFVQLREERKGLELLRHQILKDRSQLEQGLNHHEERKMDADRQMQLLVDEHEKLNLELELPLHVDIKLTTTLAEVRNLEKRYKKVQIGWEQKNGELRDKKTVILLLVKQYADHFGADPPIQFMESLSQVRQKLVEEQLQQDDVRRELQRLMGVVESRLEGTRTVLKLWNSVILIHKLDDPLLELPDVGMELMGEIVYRLELASREMIERLQRQHELIDEEQKKVTANRRRFRDFCQGQVQDVKLREMAERGLDAQESYVDLLEFEASIQTSILKANQIAEIQIQTEDQKLQQFITHMHAHLRLISQELRELPKRTRVRTETGNKEIYAFQVPDWDHEEGKERLRNHIEWIIAQLEHPKYRDADGTEQVNVVRKDIEKWLDAKQLLQKVFPQGATIRISCRKVNNDQRVTGASYSWEESNRWSGGEKWSKNMTLFLGILNYVAERRQHIHSQMQRHRAVILDNPFGKASSDHVLSPVFYIAQQLGFQIIALTAHVEGKFLKDYFPIVYSCRLRSAVGGGGRQIVDPEQWIQQAYFRDHVPESMERIGKEIKQMELF